MRNNPTKHYPCPVCLSVDDIRAYDVANPQATAQERQKWYRENYHCPFEAEYVGPWVEHVVIPFNKTLNDYPKAKNGKPLIPGGVMHEVLVKCPIHGKKVISIPGNHVTGCWPAPRETHCKYRIVQQVLRFRMDTISIPKLVPLNFERITGNTSFPSAAEQS